MCNAGSLHLRAKPATQIIRSDIPLRLGTARPFQKAKVPSKSAFTHCPLVQVGGTSLPRPGPLSELSYLMLGCFQFETCLQVLWLGEVSLCCLLLCPSPKLGSFSILCYGSLQFCNLKSLPSCNSGKMQCGKGCCVLRRMVQPLATGDGQTGLSP